MVEHRPGVANVGEEGEGDLKNRFKYILYEKMLMQGSSMLKRTDYHKDSYLTYKGKLKL
mgnify:CR=1 FL=1